MAIYAKITIFIVLYSFFFCVGFCFHSTNTAVPLQTYKIHRLFSSSSSGYLERMVARKTIDVDSMLRKHTDPSDPVVMRMSYMASESKFNLTRSLLRQSRGESSSGSNASTYNNRGDESSNNRMLSLIVDMKRKSPTVPAKRNIVEFDDAGKFCEALASVNVDAFMVNVDKVEYGGAYSELKECSSRLRAKYTQSPPAVLVKDIIIHPIQIAQALNNGAAGVLLIACVVGTKLEELLDACTIMGTEALVEVHTPAELEYALSVGATMFLANTWDRFTGEHFPDQTKALIGKMPFNCVALATGNIKSVERIIELGYEGYDGVVIGRHLEAFGDLHAMTRAVHAFQGLPKGPKYGLMKGLSL